MTPKADDSDSDHVPIQNISPHSKSGTSDTFFDGSHQSFSDSETKTQNPYDNINFDALGYSQPLKTDPISTTTHSTISSATSQRSNGKWHFFSFYLFLMLYAMCYVSCVVCHFAFVMCYVLCFVCHVLFFVCCVSYLLRRKLHVNSFQLHLQLVHFPELFLDIGNHIAMLHGPVDIMNRMARKHSCWMQCEPHWVIVIS